MSFSWDRCHSFVRGVARSAAATEGEMRALEAFAGFPLAADHRAMLETEGWWMLEVDQRPHGTLCGVRLHLYSAGDSLRASQACGLPARLPQTVVLGHNGRGDLLVMTAGVRPRGIYRVSPRALAAGLPEAGYIVPDVTALLNRAVNLERVFEPVAPAVEAEYRAEQVAVEDSYARAMAQHADLVADAASGFMAEFHQRHDLARAVYDPMFLSPDWPEVLAEQVRKRVVARR